jgi:hypothetical protein
MLYQMQEGYLTLGEGDWQDRTVTVPGAIDEASRTELLSAMKSFKPGPVPVEQGGRAK